MKHQVLNIKAVPWVDAPSGQKTVEFETSEGMTFACLVDGGDVRIGDTAIVERFDYLDAEGDDVFALNPRHERRIRQIGEWDVEIRGQIVALDEDTGLVDCGGVVLPLYHLTVDPAAIGCWVGAILRRLEAELEG